MRTYIYLSVGIVDYQSHCVIRMNIIFWKLWYFRCWQGPQWEPDPAGQALRHGARVQAGGILGGAGGGLGHCFHGGGDEEAHRAGGRQLSHRWNFDSQVEWMYVMYLCMYVCMLNVCTCVSERFFQLHLFISQVFRLQWDLFCVLRYLQCIYHKYILCM